MNSHSVDSTTDFPLQFNGKSGEFFKIWIVNIVLSILTLGIYSAWAKVRTRRYFYSNTLLMGNPFDYLGEPVKILKGRLIAFAILIIYSISPSISPVLQGGLLVLFVPLLPFIIVKALNFNAYNTAYRNIRFNFKGRYLQALWVFIGLPFIVALTIGLAYPYFTRARKKFIISNMAYGTSSFEFEATTGQFYSIYLKAIGMILALAAIFGIVAYNLMPTLNPQELIRNEETALLIVLVIMPIYFLSFLLIFTSIYTAILNLVINQTRLADHHFSGHLQFGKMLWISVSSLLAIMCSFGLMIPWAMIRMTRYRIESITLHVKGNPDEFIAAETQKIQAIGEEIGDIFDLDIGL